MWSKIGKGIALMVVILIVAGLLNILFLSKEITRTIYVGPTSEPRISEEGDSVESWQLDTYQLSEDLTQIDNSRIKIIDTCDGAREIVYFCEAQTRGAVMYELEMTGTLEGSTEVITASVGISPEISAELTSSITNGISVTTPYEQGYVYTVEVNEVSLFREGNGKAHDDIGHILNGNFMLFTGSCDINLKTLEKTTCSVAPSSNSASSNTQTQIEPTPRTDFQNTFPDKFCVGHEALTFGQYGDYQTTDEWGCQDTFLMLVVEPWKSTDTADSACIAESWAEFQAMTERTGLTNGSVWMFSEILRTHPLVVRCSEVSNADDLGLNPTEGEFKSNRSDWVYQRALELLAEHNLTLDQYCANYTDSLSRKLCN